MTMSNTESQLLQELTCPLCLELFCDPLVLPCCHNACKNCLDDYIKHADPGGKVFECPVCKETTINNAQIKNNRVLKNIAETWRSWIGNAKKEVNIFCQICEKAAESDTSYYCDDCNITYCCTCKSSFHPTKGVLANHNIIFVTEAKNSFNAQTNCPIHRKNYTHFCTDCRKLLCSNCKHISLFTDHKCEAISDVYTTELNKLQAVLQSTLLTQINLERALADIKSYQVCLMGVKKRRVKLIREHFSALRNILERKEQMLVQKENSIDKRVAEQESSIRDVQLYMSNLHTMISVAERTISRGCEAELLMTTPTVITEIIHMINTRYKEPDATHIPNIPEMIDTTGVLNEISLLDTDLGCVDKKEYTATYLVHNVHKLGYTKAYSEKWTLNGHSWYLQAFRADNKLRFGLVFDAKPGSRIPVNAECRLLQWDSDKKTYVKHFDETRTFTLDNSKWGKVEFIDWDDLFHSEESYVRNDKIRLQIHMSIGDM